MPARGRRWSRRHLAFTLLIVSAAPAAAQERMSFRADMELPPALGATWLIVGSVAVSDVRRVTASSNDFKGHDVLADRLKLVETSCTVD